MLGKRFLKCADRLVKALLAHVENAEIEQSVSFRVTGEFAANVNGLPIAFGCRVKIIELEVNVAEGVKRDAAGGAGPD